MNTSDLPSADLDKSPNPDLDLNGTGLWQALSQTPGIGISITDIQGNLIFVNDTSLVLFSGQVAIDYRGKSIADFHPAAFVKERLELIRRVLSENRPLRIHHVYAGHSITSTVWPLKDRGISKSRVIVVSRAGPPQPADNLVQQNIETFHTEYIELGSMNVLSQRELEVLVLLGHGLTIPEAAKLLNRSPKTIQRHKESISKKIHLHRQSDLVELVTGIGLTMDDTKLKRL
jgi:DNA-binding CsgD family transcriptional regulator